MSDIQIVYTINCDKCNLKTQTLNINEITELCEDCNSPLEIRAAFSNIHYLDSQEISQIYRQFLRKQPRQHKLNTFKLANCKKCETTKYVDKNLLYCSECGNVIEYTNKDINENFNIRHEIWTTIKNTLFDLCQMNIIKLQDGLANVHYLYVNDQFKKFHILNDTLPETQIINKKNENLADVVDELLNKSDPVIEEIQDDTN